MFGTMIRFIQLLNVQLTFILYNNYNFVLCDYVTNVSEEAFQTTWSLIKAKVPANLSLEKAHKRSALSRYTLTTERQTYMLEIPVLPVPRSRYQYMYRMDVPSPLFNMGKGNRGLEESYQKSEIVKDFSPENDLSVEPQRKGNKEFADSHQSSGMVEESPVENDLAIEQERLEAQWIQNQEAPVITTTAKAEAPPIYLLDFKNFRVKFFYNVILDI